MLQQRFKFSLKHILIIYSIMLFAFFAFLKYPNRYGDGFEYIYMAESFIQHKTPELLDSDLQIAQSKLRIKNAYIPIAPPKNGYFETDKGEYYSCHFWLYPLIVSPIQQVIHFLSGNELKAFQITNLLFYLLMLWIIYFYSPKEKRRLLIILMAISPLVPYITWTHPEVFCASLVTIALVFYLKGNLAIAILTSALAANQNPPIGFLTIWCGIVYLHRVWTQYRKENVFDLRSFILTGFCGIPLMFSPLFYFIHFSAFNLIQKAGGTDIRLITFHKLFSYFFDLNQGAILFSGILLFVFIGCVLKNIIRKDFKYIEFVICTLLFAGLSLAAPNWNCSISCVIRYFVWTYPLLVFYVVYASSWSKKTLLVGLLVFNAFVLAVIHDGFSGEDNYMNHNTIAQYVLSNYPSLYNPEHEIFIERTLHREGPSTEPVVFLDKTNRIRKILTNKKGWQNLGSNGKYLIANQQFYQEKLRNFDQSDNTIEYIDILNDEIILSSVQNKD